MLAYHKAPSASLQHDVGDSALLLSPRHDLLLARKLDHPHQVDLPPFTRVSRPDRAGRFRFRIQRPAPALTILASAPFERRAVVSGCLLQVLLWPRNCFVVVCSSPAFLLGYPPVPVPVLYLHSPVIPITCTVAPPSSLPHRQPQPL